MTSNSKGSKGLNTLSNKQLERIIAEIDQAIEWHQSWYKQLLRSLISNVPANKHDLSDNAHTFCEFGQWFNKLSTDTKKLHPHFSEMGTAHQKMHQGAKVLLSLNEAKSAIPVSLLDQFHADLDTLRDLFEAVSDEFSDVLHTRDPLTGATDRTNLLSHLRKEHERCKRHSQR